MITIIFHTLLLNEQSYNKLFLVPKKPKIEIKSYQI